ncbi:helix-turn-helix transcriptional regulator [Bradyrhizobium sp. UFLA 03-164]|uniref:Helix-turn-helix transcriptional regulator n=2 Tax=Bradyrhizobium uaiense TaxID=2594946 RepID=A0A6P1BP74_9BRAD|nr:helix-turn-helix transcriptional regulator [Bradyrhizobium uaiense]
MVDMGQADDPARRRAIGRSLDRNDQPARIEKIISVDFARTALALRPDSALPISLPVTRALTQSEGSSTMRGKLGDRSPELLSIGSACVRVSDAAELRADTEAAGRDSPAASNRGWAPLLEACLADFKEATETGDTARIPALVKIVADLALIERGAIRPGSRRAQQALRAGRLSVARRLITRHLAKPSLSPGMVADMLGVSVRYLHVLFEVTGASFSQTVTAERLSESRRLLCEKPPRPIADVALSCGFGSLATFYRIFSASEGLTPGEYRAEGH